MLALYKGCMKGRTMYVIPFSMGPVGSPWSKIAVEITDSPYVVCNMHIMTRVGGKVIDLLNKGEEYIPCLHSLGAPLRRAKDVAWPCAPMEKKYISHFPDENTIWSYGSGYGGNALLGKKCLALRLGSAIARREGWMAEHMIILRLPIRKAASITLRPPSHQPAAKLNLAMIQPTIPGWKAECIGDDIAWMKICAGRTSAGRSMPKPVSSASRPGLPTKSNPMAMDTIKKKHHFHQLRVDRRRRYLVGRDGRPAHAFNRLWKGQRLDTGQQRTGPHMPTRVSPLPGIPVSDHFVGLGKNRKEYLFDIFYFRWTPFPVSCRW